MSNITTQSLKRCKAQGDYPDDDLRILTSIGINLFFSFKCLSAQALLQAFMFREITFYFIAC